MLVSNRLRLTGFSGFDTESMVEQLMKAEYTKVDTMKQKLQKLKWQQEGYREMINVLKNFRDKYLDILSKDNLISATSFRAYSISTKINGVDTTAVQAEASSSVATGTHTIKVTQLAKNEIWESNKTVSKSMASSIDSINWDYLKKGKTFDITLDGVKKTITLSNDYSGPALDQEKARQLVAELNEKISDAFGAGNVEVIAKDADGNKIDVKNVDDINKIIANIEFKATGHTLKISDTTNTYVSSLGFYNNQTNAITGSKLTSFPVDLSDGTFKISVNGEEKVITLPSDKVYNEGDLDTLASDLSNAINDAFGKNVVKVTATDDQQLKIISYNTSDEIKFSNGDTNNILSKLGFNNGAKISKLEGAPDLTISEIGKEFDIYVDGKKISIDLTEEIANGNIDRLAEIINDKVQGEGIEVAVNEGKLVFKNTNGKEIRIANSTHQTVKSLGFTNGTTNVLNLKDTLGNAFEITDDVKLEINGVSFTFKATDTIQSVMDQINKSNAGVNLSYNSVSDKFILQGEKEGAANKIRISTGSPEGDKLMKAMFGESGPNIKQEAADAKFILDGVETTRSSNTFEVDGIKYTLNSVTNGEEVEITINSDPDQLVTKIKDFVNAYNELIGKINAKTSESRKKASTYEYYEPLTDEQKKEMSEKDIELWEEAAKTGLLRNDATLMKITESMRRALYDAVEGVGLRIFDIGITTSTAYTDKGKLVIDEEKLRKAIEENPDQVAELFTKKSNISYNDSENRSKRYAENGLSARLQDIINDNIRTTMDSKGYRGILIEKAGLENTTTVSNNWMSKEIDRQSQAIEEFLEKLERKENNYFAMFARMESALASLNNQTSYFTSMLGQQ
jgi:flagellar hook-associated protein 2